MSNKEQAQKEWESVRQWVLDEEDKVMEKIKSEGRYVSCLDGNHEEFAYIYAERNRRLKEIREKYHLN